MATIEIPDEVYEKLAERARVNGHTVTEEALALLGEEPDQMDRGKYLKLLARREKAAVLTFDKRLRQLCTEMHIPLADA